MKFVDEAIIEISGGNGGAGAVSFRREKYIPLGGPDGGDGGRGGNVIFIASKNINTLYDVRFKKHIFAASGSNGMGNNKYGRKGKDERVLVPVGTLIFDQESGELIADLVHDGQQHTIVHGGIGGRGNTKFKTSTNKAPKFAQDGLPGEKKKIRLELKLLADIGIIGFPSVGKSTFISVVSNAKPKIAEYHFTTLVPNLGMVAFGDYHSYVIADIPGIIEGAAEGAGLGHRFLRHVERTKFLLHMVEVNPARRSPVEDIKILNNELSKFSSELARKEQVYVLNKTDIYGEQDLDIIEELKTYLKDEILFEISAVSRIGVSDLLNYLGNRVLKMREQEEAEIKAEQVEEESRFVDVQKDEE